LGIHLIKEIMDEIEYAYENGHNILSMKIIQEGCRPDTY
jgi:anti-sigma regulatory factor (Ser/Thr protein kinase)